MKKILKISLICLALVAFTGVAVTNPVPGFFSTAFCDSTGCSVKSILMAVINIFLGFAGLISLAYIILGGFQVATAGASDRAEKGKKTLTNAIIGLVIILMSYIIITMVVAAAYSGSLK